MPEPENEYNLSEELKAHLMRPLVNMSAWRAAREAAAKKAESEAIEKADIGDVMPLTFWPAQLLARAFSADKGMSGSSFERL